MGGHCSKLLATSPASLLLPGSLPGYQALLPASSSQGMHPVPPGPTLQLCAALGALHLLLILAVQVCSSAREVTRSHILFSRRSPENSEVRAQSQSLGCFWKGKVAGKLSLASSMLLGALACRVQGCEQQTCLSHQRCPAVGPVSVSHLIIGACDMDVSGPAGPSTRELTSL